jgi:prepilin-type N-terminal cleavage/methylation domain-containing protein
MGWSWKGLHRKERGFTLIELVVVLAIIGILIAAAVPLYLGARQKAYKAEASNALQEIKTMEWAYYQQYNTFVNGTLGSIGFTQPGNANWTYSVGTGTAASVVATAVGTTGTPVAGQSMTLTLSSDGSTQTSASF